MSSEAEMKRVMQHCAEQLKAAIEAERGRSYPEPKVLIPMAYAVGVLDLLATYLSVNETPPAPVATAIEQAKPAATGRAREHAIVPRPDGYYCRCGVALGSRRQDARAAMHEHRAELDREAQS